MSSLIASSLVEDIPRSIRLYATSWASSSTARDQSNLSTSPHSTAVDDHLMISRIDATSLERLADVASVRRSRRGQGGAVSFYIEAGDLQAEYERATAAGATIVDPISERPWGQSEFVLADPDGFWWAVWKQG